MNILAHITEYEVAPLVAAFVAGIAVGAVLATAMYRRRGR